MWFLNFYIGGVYIAILIYVILLEFSSFRNYLDALLDAIKSSMNNPISMHNYVTMMMISYLVGFGSWISIILLFLIIIDFIKYERAK